MPTHRSYPENQQDPIRYRNLVDAAEQSLKMKYNGRETRAILEKLRELTDIRAFWNHTLDGLAVVAAADRFDVFRIPRTLPERAIVADSFHVKPLLRYAQSADRFQVLGVTRTETFLYEGNRYEVNRVDTTGLIPTFAEAVGDDQVTEPQRSRLTTGGRMASTGHFSGHGARKDELDVDTERFFREVSRAAMANISDRSKLPIVLVALPQHQTEFRKHWHNPYLLEDGVPSDPGALPPEKILAEAWKIVEPYYLKRLAELVEAYGTASARQKGGHLVADIARACRDGRIGTLLVDADKTLPGKVDATTGDIHFEKLEHPDVDDLLDDLAELTLRSGGEVVVVPHDKMPTDTGVAAIYRF
jgi:hypothetical protein